MTSWVSRNPVLVAATVGFVMPACWVALGMLLFATPSDVPLLDIAERVTYPLRMWDHAWPPLVGPILNAGLYAAFCATFRRVSGRSIIVSRDLPATGVRRSTLSLDERELSWFKAAVATGLVGSLLLVEPGPKVPMSEMIGGVVIFGLVLGLVVYVFFLMGRVFAWSLTTGQSPNRGTLEDDAS